LGIVEIQKKLIIIKGINKVKIIIRRR